MGVSQQFRACWGRNFLPLSVGGRRLRPELGRPKLTGGERRLESHIKSIEGAIGGRGDVDAGEEVSLAGVCP